LRHFKDFCLRAKARIWSDCPVGATFARQRQVKKKVFSRINEIEAEVLPFGNLQYLLNLKDLLLHFVKL